MIIAIDGPAGSGKTTVGRMVAEALGFALVDTGLFYRAVTVEARRRGLQSGHLVRVKRANVALGKVAKLKPIDAHAL
jgi:cytidylate kinase